MLHSQTVELPHDATINTANNKLTLSLGNVNLVFTLEEWSIFCDMIDDINVALQTGLVEQSQHCSSCGSVDVSIFYEEPSGDEIN